MAAPPPGAFSGAEDSLELSREEPGGGARQKELQETEDEANYSSEFEKPEAQEAGSPSPLDSGVVAGVMEQGATKPSSPGEDSPGYDDDSFAEEEPKGNQALVPSSDEVMEESVQEDDGSPSSPAQRQPSGKEEEVPPFEEEVEELPAEKTEGEESSKIDTDAYVEEEFEPDSDHK